MREGPRGISAAPVVLSLLKEYHQPLGVLIWARRCLEVTDHSHIVNMASEASVSSSEETVAKIEIASEMNEDPAVAEVIQDAAVAADTTAARIGWLRSLVSRFRFERVA